MRYIPTVMVVFVLTLPATALAQAEGAATHVIDFTPVVLELLTLIGSLAVTVLAIMVPKWLKDWFGVKLDESSRAALQDGLERAVSYGIGKAKDAAQDVATVETKRKIVADATNYVLERFPQARDRFGLTNEAIVQMVVSRLEDREEAGKIPPAAKAGAKKG